MGEAMALVGQAWQAIEDGDLDRIGALFDADAELSTSAGAGQGRQYAVDLFARHHSGYPDLRHEVIDSIESADGAAVALRLAFTATHLGELRGPFGAVPPTGRRLNWRSADQVRIRSGRIVSWHAQFDRLTVLQQLGITPPARHERNGATTQAQAGKKALRRVLTEVFEQGRIDVLDEVVTPDFVNHRVPPGLGPTVAGVKRVVAMERAAFPDLTYTVEREVEEGDFVIQVALARGTHLGTIFGVPGTGREVSWRQVHIARIRDGRMAEHWGVSDLAALWVQIGRAAPIEGVSAG